MWFRIELAADGQVLSCAEVADSSNPGRSLYVEAESKDQARQYLKLREQMEAFANECPADDEEQI